jgi:hypothetical protein
MYFYPHGQYEEPHIKHMQVVYLAKCEKLDIDKISAITGYAISTIKTYVHKFSGLLEKAKTLFTLKAKDIIIALCSLGKPKTEKCYLFKFYDENGNILFSKVGTTTRAIIARLKEEIKTYIKNGFDIRKAVICSVYDCGAIPAEGAESYARAHFIKEHKTAFKKNDRFMNIDISTSDFNKIIEEYLGGSPP